MMNKTHTFRFVDDALNRKLIALLERQASAKFSIDKRGAINYSHDEEDLIGNSLIGKIRASVFRFWQIVSFPTNWKDSYEKYMIEHKIPFCGEIRDANLRFLIPLGFRPHSWKLEQPTENSRNLPSGFNKLAKSSSVTLTDIKAVKQLVVQIGKENLKNLIDLLGNHEGVESQLDELSEIRG